MPDGYFVPSRDIPQVEMREGIHRRTMGITDEVMLCEFFLEAGAVVALHSHMNDQVGYVVSGKLDLTIGDETHTLLPGDSYAIPGGVEHEATALTDTILIDVFSPPRNDYRTEAR